MSLEAKITPKRIVLRDPIQHVPGGEVDMYAAVSVPSLEGENRELVGENIERALLSLVRWRGFTLRDLSDIDLAFPEPGPETEKVSDFFKMAVAQFIAKPPKGAK